MKRKIIILVFAAIAAMFSSCLNESDLTCPNYMYFSFVLDDKYDTGGDFDTRIANDVLLYVYSDNEFLLDTIVPYDYVKNNTLARLKKMVGQDKKVTVIAWAVPHGGDNTVIPSKTSFLNELYMELPTTKSQKYAPITYSLYMDTVVVKDRIDKKTVVTFNMLPAYYRMIVNVRDPFGKYFDDPAKQPRIELSGTGNRMYAMDKGGGGNDVIVTTNLNSQVKEKDTYTTGDFGLFPSTTDNSIVIKIYNGDDELYTLKTSLKATVGGMAIIDYTLGAISFSVTVGDYRTNVTVVEEI